MRHEAPAPCLVLEACANGLPHAVGCVTIIACRWNWWLPRRPALLLRVEPSGSCLRPTPFRSQPGDLKAGPGCRPETRAWITARPRRLVPSLRRFSPAGLLLSCRDAHLAAPRASPPKRGLRGPGAVADGAVRTSTVLAPADRASQVSAAGRAQTRSRNLRVSGSVGSARHWPRPAFMKTRYSEPIAVGDRPADNLLGLAHGGGCRENPR